jgi:DNA-binding HxlR family transcriptional regulator
MSAIADAMRIDYSRPFQRAAELIGQRWTGCVIRALLGGPQRFNALLYGIPGISDRVLSERLRALEDAELVIRHVDQGPPVRVSYELTDRALALRSVFAAVDAWAAEEER